MRFANLTYFKLYSFAYDTIKLELSYEAFVRQMKIYDLESVFDRIASCYDHIPGIEVWNDQVLDALLYQIDHFEILERYESPESRTLILNELRLLLGGFGKMATSRMKSSGVRFDFYRKPMPVHMGYMLMRGAGRTRLFIKMDTINNMSTNDPQMVDTFSNAFMSTVDKSMALGIGNERERTLFFRGLMSKIIQALES